MSLVDLLNGEGIVNNLPATAYTNVTGGDRQDNAAPLVTFPRDALLVIEEVAAALRVGVRSVERMDLPTVYLGRRSKRYLWGQVLDFLKERAA